MDNLYVNFVMVDPVTRSLWGRLQLGLMTMHEHYIFEKSRFGDFKFEHRVGVIKSVMTSEEVSENLLSGWHKYNPEYFKYFEGLHPNFIKDMTDHFMMAILAETVSKMTQQEIDDFS